MNESFRLIGVAEYLALGVVEKAAYLKALAEYNNPPGLSEAEKADWARQSARRARQLVLEDAVAAVNESKPERPVLRNPNATAVGKPLEQIVPGVNLEGDFTISAD